jgi:hypothetical protein
MRWFLALDPPYSWDTSGIMPERSKNRPRDPNQLAYQVRLESTGQAEKFTPQEKPKNPAAVALGRLGGLKGGTARFST